MKKEKLTIKNFGPIKSIDLDLGRITILIGEQASGKSTVAKVLAMCRFFSYIVNYQIDIKNQDQFNSNDQFLSGLRKWGIEGYLKEDSKIIYENWLYRFEFKNKLETEYETVVTDNDLKKQYHNPQTRIRPYDLKFKKLLDELKELKDDELGAISEDFFVFDHLTWTPNENFYRLNVKKVMDNPLYIPTERGIQSSSIGNDLLVSEALSDELSKLNRIVRGFNIEMEIEPLSLTYKNQNGLGLIKKDDDDKYYTLHTGASGFQSTIPLVLAMKFYNKFDTRKRTFIIEEPEQNLFPKAQKSLMEFLINCINQNGHSLLITTHSPYNLTALENLMYAFKLGNSLNGKYEDFVGKIIEKKFWIDPKNVNVYSLEKEGQRDLMNREETLIDKEYIDSVSKVINDDFDRLLEIELVIEKDGEDGM
jgi:predicted ATPase